jgi:hypothetical protein
MQQSYIVEEPQKHYVNQKKPDQKEKKKGHVVLYDFISYF